MGGVGLVATLIKSGLLVPLLGGAAAGGAMPANVLEVTRASEPPPCVQVLLHL
jgi:hypothetical protein